jgi:hypothetical protein
MSPLKKFNPDQHADNIVVEVMFMGPDDNEYRCVGVIVRENDEMIRVCFTARDDEVADHLDIKNEDILLIKQVETQRISHFE